MHRTSYAYATLNASLESFEEPSEEQAIPKGHGLESLDLREHAQVVKLLDQQIQSEMRKLDAAVHLQSSMESHGGSLSPFQAEMMAIASKQIGFELAHQRHGLGLESYSGGHGRMLLRASLEGFKDWFKEFLARLAKLWTRFIAWLKSFFDRRFIELRRIRNLLSSSFQRSSMTGGSVASYRMVFVNSAGDLDVKGVTQRSQKFIDSVMSAEYMSKVTGYSKNVMDMAARFLQAEGNSWRKFAADVAKIEFPIPASFSKMETKNKTSKYQSEELANRRLIVIEVAENEHVQGHRGAGEYVDQLAISDVSVMGRNIQENGTNAVVRNISSKSEYDAICRLIDSAIASESRTRPFLKSSQDMLRKIEEMKSMADSGEGVDPHAARLASQLLSSVRKSDKAAADLLNQAVDVAVQIGRAGTHLAATTLS